MLARLVSLLVRLVVRGPAKSWIFTSGAMGLLKLVKKTTGRRELIDLADSKPGDKFVIEHLSVSHKTQIKDEKRSKKAAKKVKRAAKRDLRKATRVA